MNTFDKNMDEELHRHHEVAQGDTVLTFSTYDVKADGSIELDICRTDNEGKLKFNSMKMFFTQEQFMEVCEFLDDARRFVSLRKQSKMVEEFRLDWLTSLEQQASLIEESDTDHVDVNRPNLFRDVVANEEIRNKFLTSKSYCKRFYASLCNTNLYKEGFNEEYGYSWRSAGGFVADVLGVGDYIDWYCSGNEGHIDEEVQEDIGKLGWRLEEMEFDTSQYKQGKLV